MWADKLLGILLLFIILCIYLHHTGASEDFSSKREKASAVFGWFSKNSDPQYTDYKRQVPDSNIVDYNEVKKLLQNKDLTLSSVERALS
jgi:hypothetical protein